MFDLIHQTSMLLDPVSASQHTSGYYTGFETNFTQSSLLRANNSDFTSSKQA